MPLEPAMEQTLQTIVERDAQYNRFVMEVAQAGKVITGACPLLTFIDVL